MWDDPVVFGSRVIPYSGKYQACPHVADLLTEVVQHLGGLQLHGIVADQERAHVLSGAGVLSGCVPLSGGQYPFIDPG